MRAGELARLTIVAEVDVLIHRNPFRRATRASLA